MEAPISLHGRCVPWQIGTGNRRQICDFEVQPPPHNEMPRWVQEKPQMLQSTCQAPNQEKRPSCGNGHQGFYTLQRLPDIQQQQQQPFVRQQQPGIQQQCPGLQHQPRPQQQQFRMQQQQQQPDLQQQLRLQRLFGDEMLLSDFEKMGGMERRFYVPPEFRQQQQQQLSQQGKRNEIVRSERRECRSMCMPKGMGAIDPNCQGEDYRLKSGYQPSRPGDAVDRRFDPCDKRRSFRDGTSEGHKANHWQFGKDRDSSATPKASGCEKTGSCPENEMTVGNRSVYPKLGGMIPGYGGHVPGFERCKFGKTFGRETADVLRKVKSTDKIPKSYTMAEWRTKCYNKEVNC